MEIIATKEFIAAAVVAAAVGGTTVYSAQQQKKTAEKSIKASKAMQAKQLESELQAGEYYTELTKEQMKLQADQNQMSLLVNLIKNRQQAEPTIFTLPPAKEPAKVGAIEQFNQAIDRLIRGT
jgi:ATPase subunit of ABC transporter with duplicated ATPase domains